MLFHRFGEPFNHNIIIEPVFCVSMVLSSGRAISQILQSPEYSGEANVEGGTHV